MELLLTPAPAVAAPSAWVQRWAHLLRPAGTVLDLACGSGRHSRWLAARGHRVCAVDRDPAALRGLAGVPGVEALCADLEAGAWPLAGRRFDAVVVTNYLWRPLWPALRDSLAEGDVLVYETFAQGQASIGKPSNPQFLLQPGELLQAFAGLRVVAFEDGFVADPGRFVQRIVVVQPGPGSPAIDRASARYSL